MLYSTIIPTVDRHTLERSVKSALKQKLGPELHEILVLNNSKGQLMETDWMTSGIKTFGSGNRSQSWRLSWRRLEKI